MDSNQELPVIQPELSVIRPNRSVWVLPDGSVVDVETEGRTKDGAAFSHGIFVKNWIKFYRNDPDSRLAEQAEQTHRRALQLLVLDPRLKQDLDEDGFPNPFSGDLAYNHAAEEQGWVRIKPRTNPLENVSYAETVTLPVSPDAQREIETAARAQNWQVIYLEGGALGNRGWI